MSSVNLNRATGTVRLHCHWSALVAPFALLFIWYIAFGRPPPPPAFHQGAHKAIQVVLTHGSHSLLRRYHHSHDYRCDDSDGPDRRACQIHCGRPCMEPYRLCLAHVECGGIVVNEQLSFATLKRTLPDLEREGRRDGWRLARSCSSQSEWRTWLSEAASLLVDVKGVARTVHVALQRVEAHDFSCADSEGVDDGACQLRCRPGTASVSAMVGADAHCFAAYRRCIAHASCEVIELNGEHTWATLKRGVELSAKGLGSVPSTHAAEGSAAAWLLPVPSESEWATAYRTAQLAQHLAAHPAHQGAHHGAQDASSAVSSARRLRPSWRERPGLQRRFGRPIGLTIGTTIGTTIGRSGGGGELSCEEAEGERSGVCEVACLEPRCEESYWLCLALDRCAAVHVDANRTWATLKTAPAEAASTAELPAAVLSETGWRERLSPSPPSLPPWQDVLASKRRRRRGWRSWRSLLPGGSPTL